MDPPSVIEIDGDSVLLAWSEMPEGLLYELQMQSRITTAQISAASQDLAKGNDVNGAFLENFTGGTWMDTVDTNIDAASAAIEDDGGWKILSSAIKSTSIRKKTLSRNCEYR